MDQVQGARRFLVTGGAGFVGNRIVAAPRDRGEEVVVPDNLDTGHRELVPPDARLRDFNTYRLAARRPGDPAMPVAASDRARAAGWRPRHEALDQIVRTAFAWREAHPGGYGG